ncbi:hypothetical protein FA95DRAFT_1612177 [Auriscalpium vulgare]|uniref:Uncharacterized protein n=1 Tax=Auriscalpium vulgare TaxID=40419 RepID=A0ACB8R745_9AGAM|nr:hypothetical protein FA95DRAFT_1612177 [Auriscalpium vulgare]
MSPSPPGILPKLSSGEDSGSTVTLPVVKEFTAIRRRHVEVTNGVYRDRVLNLPDSQAEADFKAEHLRAIRYMHPDRIYMSRNNAVSGPMWEFFLTHSHVPDSAVYRCVVGFCSHAIDLIKLTEKDVEGMEADDVAFLKAGRWYWKEASFLKAFAGVVAVHEKSEHPDRFDFEAVAHDEVEQRTDHAET